MSVPSYPHLLTGWTFVRVSSCLWRAAEYATPKYNCRSWGHATAKCAALAYYLELWALENQQMRGEVCSELPYLPIGTQLPSIPFLEFDQPDGMDSCHRKGEEKSIPCLDSLSHRQSHLPSIFLRTISSFQLCPNLCNPMNHSMPGLLLHHQLPKSTQTHVHWAGDAIHPSHPPSVPLLLPSIFPSIRVFSDESDLRIRWPKYWSFSFNISPSNEHPGLPSVCPKNHLLSPKGSTRLPRWLSGKEYTCQCRRHGFDPWSMKIPWRRKWQPTSAFLPGKFHGQRSLVGYSPWGRKRVRHDVETKNNEETYHSPLPSLLRCYLIPNSKSPCRFISSPGYLPCISEGYMLLNFCFPLANLSFITGVSVKNWER